MDLDARRGVGPYPMFFNAVTSGNARSVTFALLHHSIPPRGSHSSAAGRTNSKIAERTSSVRIGHTETSICRSSEAGAAHCASAASSNACKLLSQQLFASNGSNPLGGTIRVCTTSQDGAKLCTVSNLEIRCESTVFKTVVFVAPARIALRGASTGRAVGCSIAFDQCSSRTC